MNKCEKSQEVISGFIEEIKLYYQEYVKNKQNLNNYLTNSKNKNFAKRVEETLMALRSCMKRYSFHIEALKEDNKV